MQLLKITALISALSLSGCAGNTKLVDYELPRQPDSCLDRPKALSKKTVKRDLDAVNAVEWHVNDRIQYAKERAKWLDCQRFLRLTWKRMQSKK